MLKFVPILAPIGDRVSSLKTLGEEIWSLEKHSIQIPNNCQFLLSPIVLHLITVSQGNEWTAM